ncbi:MAG: hypothetical protein EOO61_06965 [Hymenobacter sp.]|nr:MAG: hypothetical protein EOO61_06965 [Hymenobacter sp.]
MLLLIPDFGLGGAQRVFHDHNVELAQHYHITEAVFNLDGDNMYPSENEVIRLEVDGAGDLVTKVRNLCHCIA